MEDGDSNDTTGADEDTLPSILTRSSGVPRSHPEGRTERGDDGR